MHDLNDDNRNSDDDIEVGMLGNIIDDLPEERAGYGGNE